ncbi:MAG: monovalent cation:proton antiporter-2 (CPA2) family protein [Ectothiorhodospiraceae bacterium]|jgi:glutathione-regulated potassium-efflux system ancillary protein KefC/glutathione-regulated potassium-efflux system protein KefB
MPLLNEIALFLAAAVIAVPLLRKLGFGAILGYLAAGVVLGPWGLGIAGDVDSILHFAEVGVVFLLFIIGLELQPARLWVLRRAIFGLGLTQVLATGAVFTAIAWSLGVPMPGAWIVGFGLSLSSTAFVLQLLAERKQLGSQHGRAAFGVLLFQDLAVIPMLAVLPLLAPTTDVAGGDALVQAARVVAIVIGFLAGGRYLLRPVLRLVAAADIHEVFTAAALLLVLGAAMLFQWAGLSMALGAFLAGVLVADSEYRHQLEADIEPFKGLLLGLFFMGVGMAANLGIVAERPFTVVAVTAGLIAGKFTLALVAAAALRIRASARAPLAAALAQGGEFAFVLFGAASHRGLLTPELSELLVVAVTLSMALTPAVVLAQDRIAAARRPREERPFDTVEDTEHQVVIAGFGRFGQIVGRLLRAQGIPFTALEASPAQVDFVRRYGNRIHYGDAARLDLLRAARVDKARLFLLTVDDPDTSVRVAETVKRHFPRVRLLARARNRQHAHRLMELGAEKVVRETFYSSLKLGESALSCLGLEAADAAAAARLFDEHDHRTLQRQYALRRDPEALIKSAKEAAEELRELFDADEAEGRRGLRTED